MKRDADAMAGSDHQTIVCKLDEPGAPADSVSSWVKVHFGALGETIAAGTSEIQRNIIAERVLGLPREPKP